MKKSGIELAQLLYGKRKHQKETAPEQRDCRKGIKKRELLQTEPARNSHS